MQRLGSRAEASAVATGRHPAPSDTNIARSALLEVDTRGRLPNGLRTSTDVADFSKLLGADALQHAPRASGILARADLQMALFSSIVGGVDHGGA